MCTSCYKYVEIKNTGPLQFDIKTSSFLCFSDSAAYTKAYEKFCISQSASRMVRQQMQKLTPDLLEYLDEPEIDFKLYKFNKDITNATFLHNKAELENQIETKMVNAMERMTEILQKKDSSVTN